jgi:nitroimidazol reductase NimA-like FMN-containing flavoprotein (pyridoxamine 5'-phosphate oxidase superfamily)
MPMLVPATELDRVYSDPAATETTWEETRKVLETAELFWISTVRTDGRPHVTPVVAAWWDDAVLAQGDPFGHTRHTFPGRAGLDGGSQ